MSMLSAALLSRASVDLEPRRTRSPRQSAIGPAYAHSPALLPSSNATPAAAVAGAAGAGATHSPHSPLATTAGSSARRVVRVRSPDDDAAAPPRQQQQQQQHDMTASSSSRLPPVPQPASDAPGGVDTEMNEQTLQSWPLPPGWRKALDVDSQRPYYVDYVHGTTSWQHPVVTEGVRRAERSMLPLGWTAEVDADGTVYYCHVDSNTSLWEHPNTKQFAMQYVQQIYQEYAEGMTTNAERGVRGLGVAVEAARQSRGDSIAASIVGARRPTPSVPPSLDGGDRRASALGARRDDDGDEDAAPTQASPSQPRASAGAAPPAANARSVSDAYAAVLQAESVSRSKGMRMSADFRRYKEHLRSLKMDVRRDEASDKALQATMAVADSRAFDESNSLRMSASHPNPSAAPQLGRAGGAAASSSSMSQSQSQAGLAAAMRGQRSAGAEGSGSASAAGQPQLLPKLLLDALDVLAPPLPSGIL